MPIIISSPAAVSSRSLETEMLATLQRLQWAVEGSLGDLTVEMNADLDQVDDLRDKIKRLREFSNAISPEDQNNGGTKIFSFYLSLDGSVPPANGMVKQPGLAVDHLLTSSEFNRVDANSTTLSNLVGPNSMAQVQLKSGDVMYKATSTVLTGKQVYTGYQGQISALEGKLDMLTSRSKENQIKLQQRQGQYEQVFTEQTQLVSEFKKTKEKILENLR